MANEANLVPQAHVLTVEEASRGGQISGAVRRQKKTLGQLADMIGNLSIKSEETKQKLREAGITDENLIEDTEMLFSLHKKAKKGDVKAAELLAKLRGQLKNDDPMANINIESVTINFGDKKVIDGEVS